MSGAGRGTPRISPPAAAPPIPSGNPADVIDLGNGKYGQQFAISGTPATTLTSSYQQLQGQANGIRPGMTRMQVSLLYFSGGAGGACAVRVKDNGLGAIQLPESAVVSGADNLITVLRPAFTHTPVAAAGSLVLVFELHVDVAMALSGGALNLEAKEVGNVGSPGSLRWTVFRADNVLPALIAAAVAVGS